MSKKWLKISALISFLGFDDATMNEPHKIQLKVVVILTTNPA
jgi:hypothetical protein